MFIILSCLVEEDWVKKVLMFKLRGCGYKTKQDGEMALHFSLTLVFSGMFHIVYPASVNCVCSFVCSLFIDAFSVTETI
jgi:hypothetical protein